MKKRIKYCLSTMLHLALCLCLLLPAGLAGASDAQHSIGYAARALLPENQLGSGGYFNLLMQPGQRQIIEVEIANHENEPLVVTVEINGAHTNQNGLIVYTKEETGEPTPFEQIPGLATVRLDGLNAEGNRVAIGPLETVRVPIEIVMPEQPIEGQLLGGIVITKMEDTPSGAGASFAIHSLYSYAFALQLQTSAENNIAPEFVLQAAAPASIAGWDAITVSIENTKPIVVAGANLRIRVHDAGTDDTRIDIDNQRVSIAPNTILPYTVSLPAGASLTPGSYTVTVELTYDGGTTSMQAQMLIREAVI